MKKIWKILILLTILTTMITGCTNTAPETNEKSEIRVGILSIDDVLPIVVAEKEEMFKNAGLDVKIYPFKSSMDESKAMEAGELDIIMNDMIVQGLMKKSGTDTKVISYAFGATPQEGRFVVVAPPNSDIKTPQDLYGKKVAISTNTMMDYLMNQYEKHLDLDSDKIEKINMPNLILRMETVLEGKDIQGAILPDPLAEFAISKGCIPVIDDTKLGENFSQSVILAKTDFIEKNKDQVGKFMQVYFEAMEKINEDPEKYKEIAIENAHIPDELKENYQTPTFTPNKVPTEQEVQRVTKWLEEKGLTDKEYSYEEMVSKEFIK